MKAGSLVGRFKIVLFGACSISLAGCTGEDLINTIFGFGLNLCQTDSRCNDGLFCNGEERCIDGECTNGVAPCAPQFCDEDTNACTAACDTTTCDDGKFCNGHETCAFVGDNANSVCVNGDPPCFSDEICLEASDQCVECVTRDDCAAGQLCVDDLCIDAPTVSTVLTVFLRNEDILTTHLLTAGQGFGPLNQVEPNGSRRVVYADVLTGDVFTFRAGRDGEVFATVDCQYFADPLEDAVVTWTGFALTCGGSLTTATN